MAMSSESHRSPSRRRGLLRKPGRSAEDMEVTVRATDVAPRATEVAGDRAGLGATDAAVARARVGTRHT
jgi:hypothetical protein